MIENDVVATVGETSEKTVNATAKSTITISAMSRTLTDGADGGRVTRRSGVKKMADILIKGMKMPTHCMDCPFMVSRDNDDCILQSDEANEGFENWEQMKAGCPLVPVPPHGRLIDADEILKDKVSNAYISRFEVDYAPTIIEASEDGEQDG